MSISFKDSFLRYENPFDYVIDITKKIRRLKSDYGLSSKKVENAHICIKNSEYQLIIILQSLKTLKFLCQIQNITVFYIDEKDVSNNLTFTLDSNNILKISYENSKH